MTTCPWCSATARDTFSFECGSVRPSYVTPTAMQADSCRIRMLKAKVAELENEVTWVYSMADALNVWARERGIAEFTAPITAERLCLYLRDFHGHVNTKWINQLAAIKET